MGTFLFWGWRLDGVFGADAVRERNTQDSSKPLERDVGGLDRNATRTFAVLGLADQ